MVKIRKVEITGFRGARHLLPIDLGKELKSIAIFGENASGKSTLTDALEWYYLDRVPHLWKEDCEEDALRHIALTPQEAAEVRIEFSDQRLAASKTLDGKLKKGYSNTTAEFADYLKESSTERLVLRNAYLQDFVLKTKSQKRDEIAGIIGYDAITTFREAIQRTLTRTERETTYTSAKDGLDRGRTRLLKKFGRVPRNPQEHYELANSLVEKFQLPKKIGDAPGHEACIEALKARITDPKKGEKLATLNAFMRTADEFKTILTATEQGLEAFSASYKEALRNVEKLRSIDLVAFLTKGKELIQKGTVGTAECPFCRKPISDMTHLFAELSKRVEALEEASKEHRSLRKGEDALIAKLRSASADASNLLRPVTALELEDELARRLKGYKDYTASLVENIPQKFAALEEIQEVEKHKEHTDGLLSALATAYEAARRAAQALALTAEEEAVIRARDDLILLRDNFSDIRAFAKTKTAYEAQIQSLSTILNEFIKVQNTILQDVLDTMSKDISDYYLSLHPHEEVDRLRLRILGEQGVEFTYLFHGREVHPPLKYLSESHLNSLGIALFLASVKLLNKRNRFLVLDDVVTSFDIGHRLRLLRLLQERFSDSQILLLTHEAFWFDMIKREMPASTWIFCEVDWSYERGIEIKRAARDLKQLIEAKRRQGHDVANDVRKLMEMILKEAALHLEVRLPFRFNDTNERRDVGELLSSLRGTVNRKAPDIKDLPLWHRLETCSLIASTGSHHLGAQVSSGDIDTILDDLGNLEGLFFCSDCGTYVSTRKYSEKDKRAYCSCSKKGMSWKD